MGCTLPLITQMMYIGGTIPLINPEHVYGRSHISYHPDDVYIINPGHILFIRDLIPLINPEHVYRRSHFKCSHRSPLCSHSKNKGCVTSVCTNIYYVAT
jgi:hypothetical protein